MATTCLFASDLHGGVDRCRVLLRQIEEIGPAAVFLGGDLLPPLAGADGADFLQEVLGGGLSRLRDAMGARYPRIFAILGNDDPRIFEGEMLDIAARGLWSYLHGRHEQLGAHRLYGYACVPPTPFRLKDWERYDVSRFVDPGCLSPEEGARSVPAPPSDVRYGTIRDDLERLAGDDALAQAVFLFHTPPYRTRLDRAALDGKSVDHVPLDVHVGSIAVRQFIERRQPLLTLHGHVHESARLTGAWRDRIDRTHLFSAAHDGPELALVHFDLEDLDRADRLLLAPA